MDVKRLEICLCDCFWERVKGKSMSRKRKMRDLNLSIDGDGRPTYKCGGRVKSYVSRVQGIGAGGWGHMLDDYYLDSY